jgi:hypothetical protein
VPAGIIKAIEVAAGLALPADASIVLSVWSGTIAVTSLHFLMIGLSVLVAIMMSKSKVERLKEQIADLKKRWPAHSVPPALMEQLDELEEELRRELVRSGDSGTDPDIGERDRSESQGQLTPKWRHEKGPK